MPMLYIHVPFCKQACHYCDFHFSTSLKYKEDMVNAILQEIGLRKDYLENKHIQSIYFGGGTPSILSVDDLARILQTISLHFQIDPDAEITLEANPDDLTRSKLNELKQTPINRLSIGIQSFYEEDLRWMNRAHSSEEAKSVIQRAQDTGFENLTCDLIYGFPLLSDEKWLYNIQELTTKHVTHISSYAMTVEAKTALHHFVDKGKTPPMDEEQMARQFMILVDTLEKQGYEQYEISNFAKNQRYARHNTNYWRGIPYLGLGPSAHSFDGKSRTWTVRNNAQYIKAIANEHPLLESEMLSENDQLNETIMTGLRTIWGIDLSYVAQTFGEKARAALVYRATEFSISGHLHIIDDHITLTRDGKLLADHIASELFVV